MILPEETQQEVEINTTMGEVTLHAEQAPPDKVSLRGLFAQRHFYGFQEALFNFLDSVTLQVPTKARTRPLMLPHSTPAPLRHRHWLAVKHRP